MSAGVELCTSRCNLRPGRAYGQAERPQKKSELNNVIHMSSYSTYSTVTEHKSEQNPQGTLPRTFPDS